MIRWMAILLVLAGCASRPSVTVPDRIVIPLPVPCIDPAKRPQRPVLRSAADLLGMDTYSATHALWASYARSLAYASELEAVVEGCSKLTAMPPAARDLPGN